MLPAFSSPSLSLFLLLLIVVESLDAKQFTSSINTWKPRMKGKHLCCEPKYTKYD